MVIESSERFGLSQLHQIRGRVGRGKHQSYCYLAVSQSGQQQKQRLQALVQTQDGFKLAEIDLKLRGAGEVYGTRQSGISEFKLASLQDVEVIEESQSVLNKILEKSKDLSLYPGLKKKIEDDLSGIHLE